MDNSVDKLLALILEKTDLTKEQVIQKMSSMVTNGVQRQYKLGDSNGNETISACAYLIQLIIKERL